MNSGYYTMLGAALGARVYAFEPQVFCVRIVRDLIRARNPHLAPLIDIFNMGLGTTGVIAVPNGTKCDGFFGEGGIPSVGEEAVDEGTVPIPVVNPQLVLPLWSRHVALVKMDTEGAEADILAHLLPWIEAGRIHHLVVELMPCQWANRASSLEAGLATLRRVQAASRRMVALFDPKGVQGGVQANGTADIGGTSWEGFDLEALMRDRHNRTGAANVWFTFV
ncbi:hypothetical protein HYH03_014362 [Edaphochlamys debaryana]|uniref:Methyltransferase FkbM domain-containing protein n=1 Tax=Edaphochlamys debaryana TaxID=47281 RepID=A0A835XP03_9CHLO|nr:hypothetical protein HYH03_014362 [Edaphochlamys debaryana]|eukprot:KAG2486990.1 hypothetical protein HYH03_014362 [Edaphochlamys debaryana]